MCDFARTMNEVALQEVMRSRYPWQTRAFARGWVKSKSMRSATDFNCAALALVALGAVYWATGVRRYFYVSTSVKVE